MRPSKGADGLAALRVLVDATDVPIWSRGALGRYVDRLIGALAGTECGAGREPSQLSDAERYKLGWQPRCLDRRRADRARAPGRSARLGAERASPVVAEQVGADVIHMPNYTMPMHPGAADRGHPSTTFSFCTDPDLVHRDQRDVGSSRQTCKTTARRGDAADRPVQCHQGRTGAVLLGIDPGKIDVAYHGVDHRLFHRPDDGAGQPCHRAPRVARQAVRRVPRLAGAAQERPRPGQRLGRGGGGHAGPARACPRSTAKNMAGARNLMRPSPACRPTCGLSGLATSRSRT